MLNPRHLWFGPSFWNSHIANGRILWHLQSTHWFHRLLKGTAKESPWHLLVTIRVSCKCSLEISWIHWVWLRDRDAVCQGVVVQTQLKEQFSVAWRIFDGERFVFSTKLPPWFLRSLNVARIQISSKKIRWSLWPSSCWRCSLSLRSSSLCLHTDMSFGRVPMIPQNGHFNTENAAQAVYLRIPYFQINKK